MKQMHVRRLVNGQGCMLVSSVPNHVPWCWRGRERGMSMCIYIGVLGGDIERLR